MNILYAHSRLDAGGASRVLITLADRLRRQGNKTMVVSSGGYLLEELNKKGISHFYAPLNEKQKHPYNFFKALLIMKEIVRKYKIDIIHCHHRWPAFITYYLSKRMRTPFTWTDHSILQGKRWLTRRGGLTISVSKASKTNLVTHLGFDPKKIVVIPNGVDLSTEPFPEEIKQVKKELSLTQKGPIVGTIGRLAPEKGHRYLLEAVAKIKKLGLKAYFLIVGEGPLKGKLQDFANHLGINERIAFLGYRQDVNAITANFDFSVLPSLSEGFALTILEAYALSKPVIATAVGGVPELVIEGETGFLIPSKSSQALAQRIIELLNNKKKVEIMGKRGRQLVEKKFGLEQMLQKHEEVYLRVINSKH